MAKPTTKEVNPIIKKNSSIGSADAEMDHEFLETCFFETEDLNHLLDTQTPQRIIVGRTGAGKTALLKEIGKRSKKAVYLSPENFSFRYLADSSVLNFFEAAGVNLNIFYLLLWRHVICVELIKQKYNISSEDGMRVFINNFMARISSNKAKRKAYEYFIEWGDKFWITTEERVKELTQKLESDLASNVSLESNLVKMGAAGALRLSEEEKLEVINIGRDVVNKIQIQKLTEVINLLDEEIFNDPKDKYYILIDQLDENWAENNLRYKIIRALIDTTKKLQRVKNAKIIIALREDLLMRVIRETKDNGFQEEKIEPLYLRLNWNSDELEKILDLRVAQLFKRKYNRDKVKIRDILGAGQKDRLDPLGYIFSRTFMRPREAILFFNLCLEKAVGKPSINIKIITEAETSYSRQRMRSLVDEWVADFPLLDRYANILHGMPKTFPFSELVNLQNLDDVILEIACLDELKCNSDKICRLTKPYLDDPSRNRKSLLKELVVVFYQVGILGIKLSETYPCEWSYNSEPIIDPEQIKDDTPLYVHPTFWNALGLRI